MRKVGLGGGCHWCTEAVFQSLKGVSRVQQGFIRSDPPADGWSEAVVVHFDESQIDLATLIEVHVRTHASTAQHSMRGKYRSAVYVFDTDQAADAEQVIVLLNPQFADSLVTKVLTFEGFMASDERYHNYYESDPQRPFCRRYIDPKLDLLKRRFSADVRP